MAIDNVNLTHFNAIQIDSIQKYAHQASAVAVAIATTWLNEMNEIDLNKKKQNCAEKLNRHFKVVTLSSLADFSNHCILFIFTLKFTVTDDKMP